MDDRTRIRNYLFSQLLALPKSQWPEDADDLFELGLDSLRIMRLLVFMEEQLHVVVPDTEITPERLATVESLVELVASQRA